MAKFSKSEVRDKVPEGSTLIFGDTQISLQTVWEGSPHDKYHLDSSSRFDTIPACDGQTDERMDTRRQHLPRYIAQRCAVKKTNDDNRTHLMLHIAMQPNDKTRTAATDDLYLMRACRQTAAV